MNDVSPRLPSARFAVFSIALGVLGLFASFELLTEFIRTLQTPAYIPNCNLSKIVSCGPNMGSWQGSLLGFSNTIIGIAGFMAPIFVGVAVLAGAQLHRWFWRCYMIGVSAALVFVTWLQYQSLFGLGTLCPWCIVVWIATIPLFWVTLFTLGRLGLFGRHFARLCRSLAGWEWVFVVVHSVLVAGIAQLVLDWFREFNLP